MSLLDLPAKPDGAMMIANQVLAMPRRLLSRVLREWTMGVEKVWNPPKGVTTEQVLEALGTQGGELFARSAELRAFLEQQKPGCTNVPAAGRIKAVTVGADGRVTVAG